MPNKLEVSECTPIIPIQDIQAVHSVGGLSIFSAFIFLVGEIVGVGVLALPNALARSGYPGIFLIFFAFAIAVFNGTQLAWCWTLLLERYPQYRTHCRYPYAAIGERAVGKWMKYVIAVTMGFSLLGACVLYLLIAAENIHFVLLQAGVHLNFCIWMVIFGCILVPLSWFGSPKDFRWVAMAAFLSSFLALSVVFSKLMMELPPSPEVTHPYPTNVRLYFLSFAAILFAFGGISTFPTIQHDMKKPQQFPIALAIAYFYCLAVYLSIAISGYYVYGEDISPNVLLTFSNGPMKIMAMSLYVVHLIFAYIVIINPPIQNLEEVLRIPNIKCHWKRILFRSAIVLLIVFVAESIPHFGALLDLLGGSSSAFLTFIAPPIFYMLLCKNGYIDSHGKIRFLPPWMKILNVIICIIGVVVMCTSTYAALVELSSPDTFVPPCYVNATAAEEKLAYQNITKA